MKPQTILYCRTSGDDRDRDSLSHQEKDCREYAERVGYEVLKVFAEDVRGISGQFINSPALNEALQFCEQNSVDIFLIRDIERFTREGLKGELILAQLDNLGVTLDSAWEPWIKEPTARMMLKMLFNLAEQNKESLVRKLQNGRWHSAKEGNALVHGHAPLGYISKEEDRNYNLEVYEEEAKIVRLIFSLYLDGYSLQGIANELTERGIPTYTQLRADENVFGRDPEKDGGKWAASSVKSVLTNTTYHGQFEYGTRSSRYERRIDLQHGKIEEKRVRFRNSETVLVEVPAIVSKETFDQVQTLLHENRRKKGRHVKGEYLLSKRLTCPCGKVLICEGRHDKRINRDYYYYRFSRNHCTCGRKYIPVKLIDEATWEWLWGLLVRRDDLEQKIQEFYQTRWESQATLRQRLAEAKQTLAETRREYDGLIKTMSLSDDFGRSLLVSNKQQVEKRLREQNALIDKLEKSLEPERGLNTREMRALQAYIDEMTPKRNATFAEKRRLVEKFDVRAVVELQDDKVLLEVSCKFSESVLLELCNTSRAVAAPGARRKPASTWSGSASREAQPATGQRDAPRWQRRAFHWETGSC